MLRKQALIGLTALGIAFGAGAANAMPVGLQGLPSQAAIHEMGATVQPVHYRSRRAIVSHYYVHPRRNVLVHPGFRHRHVIRRHHFAYPYPHVVRRHHYVYPRYYRTRPRVSFGLQFGW